MARPNQGPHLHYVAKRGKWYLRWFEGGAEKLRSLGTSDREVAERMLADAAPTSLAAYIQRPPQEQFVYFIGGDMGGIKIGAATNPQKRLSELQCGSPIKLSILAVGSGGRQSEQLYHQLFHAHRLHGEWFDRHPDVLAEIHRLNGLS